MKDVSEGRPRKGRKLNRYELLAAVLGFFAIIALAGGKKYETVAMAAFGVASSLYNLYVTRSKFAGMLTVTFLVLGLLAYISLRSR